MKKLFISLSLILAGSAVCFAQCDKPVVLTSSKTVYLDGSGAVTRTKDENTTINLSKTEIVIVPGDEGHRLSGPVSALTCDWKTTYKEGKTTFKAVLENPDGNAMHANITIEGKDGKVTLTFTVDEMPDKKIQVVADKFEEKA